MYPSLILIGSNKPGAGKDTMALCLAGYGYTVYGFGGFVKDEITRALTDRDYRALVWDLMPEDCQQALLVCLAMGQLDAWVKPTAPEMRSLLQLWGTEFRRVCTCDTYWTDALQARLNLDRPARVVVSDMRFPNEYSWGTALGGLTWYVSRHADEYVYTVDAMKHSSEGQMGGLFHDWRVSNDGTMADLWSAIDVQMESYLSSSRRGPLSEKYNSGELWRPLSRLG